MEIRRIICKSGNEYNIISEYWETSSAWGHKSTLLRGNTGEIDVNKVRYYNRTWECYQYQTCMKGLIEGILEKNKKEYLNMYKNDNNILRFTKETKERAIKEWEDRTYIKDLKEIKQRVSDWEFD